MKLHYSDLHLSDVAHRVRNKEERWVSNHTVIVSLILACLVIGALYYLLSSIQIYLTTGTWPLWN